MYKGIEGFYLETDLKKKFEFTEQLTDLALSPIGGAWKKVKSSHDHLTKM